MPIDATNSLVTASRSFGIGQNFAGTASQSSPDQPVADSAASEQAQQICKPSTVSLDADTVQRLSDNAAFQVLTQSSLAALSQVHQGNEQLLKLLVG